MEEKCHILYTGNITTPKSFKTLLNKKGFLSIIDSSARLDMVKTSVINSYVCKERYQKSFNMRKETYLKGGENHFKVLSNFGSSFSIILK